MSGWVGVLLPGFPATTRPLFLPCESGQRLARADCWAVVPATATGGDLDFYLTLATWGATQDKTVANRARSIASSKQPIERCVA